MRRHYFFLALMLIASLGVKAQSAREIADNMIPGINLGNTLEACNCSWLSNKLDYETGWQPTKTTQKIIDYYKQLGFKSVRIPVAWYAHTSSNYTTTTGCMLFSTTIGTVVGWKTRLMIHPRRMWLKKVQ